MSAREREILRLRAKATRLGNRPRAWDLLEEAADLERTLWNSSMSPASSL